MPVPEPQRQLDALTEPQRQLDALTELVLEVSAQRNVGDVLDVALRQCLWLTGSEFGFVGLIGSDVRQMEIVAIHGFHPSATFYAEHRVIPLRPNVFARVVLEDRAVRTEDATSDPARVGQPRGHPRVGTFLGVPLRQDGRPVGMIGLANRPAPYGDEQERLALTYASLIAVLVHNAQLYERLEETNARLERVVAERTGELAAARDALAEKASRLQAVLTETIDTQEQDRQRIAEDIHDGINQLLIGALLELTSGQHRIEAGQPEGASAALASARDILSEVESEIRRVVHDLHPPILEGLGLPASIRDVAERFEAFAGVACRVTISGHPLRLAPRAEISVYRLVQEALRNVAVHAAAKRADVALRFEGAWIEVEVSDDGRGFEVAAFDRVQGSDGRLHLGLESMRRRAESLGGQLEVWSRAGGGASVRATIPYGGQFGRPV
jgi:signal transduction histidine kinase